MLRAIFIGCILYLPLQLSAQAPQLELGPDRNLCPGDSIILDVSDNRAISYLWHDGKTVSSYTIKSSGWYRVLVSYNWLGGTLTLRDSIFVTMLKKPYVSLMEDTVLCPTHAFFLVVKKIDPELSYFWQDMTRGPSIKVFNPGRYIVYALNDCGYASDTLLVGSKELPKVSLRSDTILCAKDSIVLDAGFEPGNQYQWQDYSSGQTYTVKKPGTYIVKVKNICGDSYDTIQITQKPLPVFQLRNDTSLCEKDTLMLEAPAHDEYTYLWDNGMTSRIRIADKAATYKLSVTNICGSRSDSVRISLKPLPDIGKLRDTLICQGEKVLFATAYLAENSYLWSNGSTGNSIWTGDTGNYSLVVSNKCGTVSANAHLGILPAPPAPQLSEAVDSCLRDEYLSAGVNAFGYVWSTGENTKQIYIPAPGLYWVSTMNRCGVMSERDSTDVIAIEHHKPVFIPTAFSPNYDELNPLFRVHLLEDDLLHYKLRIYNRWGELVFISSDIHQGWDGMYKDRPAPEGAYFWSLELKLRCSRETTSIRSGSVTLLR